MNYDANKNFENAKAAASLNEPERFAGWHVEYLYSPRDTAACGYAHSEIICNVADNEDMSNWAYASDFLAQVKNDTIWENIEPGIFQGVVKSDNANADDNGIGTAWIQIVNADGKTVAESCKVLFARA